VLHQTVTVLERLAEVSASMPLKTIDCLSLIVEGDKDGWVILGWREQARTIIGTVIRSADEGARRRAVDLVHRLGTRGHFDFRDLLPPDLIS
jgi:hypothetical protein